MNYPIEIRKVSITDLTTDTIVNAANEHLAAGTGVCGAIFDAAGYYDLQKACNAISHCDTGDAVITPGFKLKAKYVIHAVGPIWNDGNHGEPDLLRSAYKKSLELAAANHCKSIVSTQAKLKLSEVLYDLQNKITDILSAIKED